MIPITSKEFELLATFIKENYGIHLRDEKQSLLMGRLHTLLVKNGFEDFSSYYRSLLTDTTGLAVSELIDRISTNHTYFMREVDHFETFKQVVIPYVKGHSLEKDVRIWCAACSTGEEAYTLAMLLADAFEEEPGFWDTKVLATDISTLALDAAKKGVYSLDKIAPLPPLWKLKYFEKHSKNEVIVTPKVREELIFRRLNLMDTSFPFKRKFHAIFCRNVMIYFDTPTKNRLIDTFYDHLEEGGYLFVGHSEAINRDRTAFKYIQPAVYQK